MTVRRVTFDGPEALERFSHLYEGFVLGGDARTAAPGMETMRREGRILDKFEAISVPKVLTGMTPQGPVSRDLRELKPGGPWVLTLEPPEYDLLLVYFGRAPWLTSASRRIVATFDWLSATPLTDEP